MAAYYPLFDINGVLIGSISFVLALFYSYYLLQKHHCNQKAILNILMISAIGHFIGAYALYYFAITQGAESIFYFENASTSYQGFGSFFAFFILGYVRAYLIGDSFLAAFILSGAIGLIASVYLFLTYMVLLEKITVKLTVHQTCCYHFDSKQIFYPALLLLCWPSYFFWSAGIVKDNFAFLGINIILYHFAKNRWGLSSLMLTGTASLLGFMVRPYLFVIFISAYFIYMVTNSNMKFAYKISLLSALAMLSMILSPFLQQYSSMVHLTGSIAELGEFAVRQQQYMAIGSSIPVPTHNPYLVFFFIPYLMSANLLLPLMIGARNAIGFISSIENLYLLYWIIWFIRHNSLWRQLTKQYGTIKFYLIYFLVGMSCLSLMSTNLGLAMREKMMYVPALLLCMLLTYAYKRTCIISHHLQTSTLTSNNEPIGYTSR
jgi:hypothetical protein